MIYKVKSWVAQISCSHVVANISWLFFDKIFRLGLGFVLGVWVAKYLGPAQFGKWNYIAALVALFSPLSTLGLDQVIIKRLVEKEKEECVILGTSFLARLIGSIVAILIFALFLIGRFYSDTDLIFIGAIISSAFLFQCFDVIELKYQAELRSKKSVVIKNFCFLIVAIVKMVALMMSAGLVFIVSLSLVEIVLSAVGLILVYSPHKIAKWSPSFNYAYSLLKEAWPLMLSSVIVIFYMRVDQIMIGSILNSRQVGLYSVSVRFAEVWFFIPSAFSVSFFPRLNELRNDTKAFESNSIKLFRLLFFISFSIAVFFSFFSEEIILRLYGLDYRESALPLVICIWSGVFVFLGVAASNILVIIGQNVHNFSKSVIGAVLNVVLNLVLIPAYGISGAAIATLISQAFASCFYYLCFNGTRRIFYLQIKAILLKE